MVHHITYSHQVTHIYDHQFISFCADRHTLTHMDAIKTAMKWTTIFRNLFTTGISCASQVDRYHYDEGDYLLQ